MSLGFKQRQKQDTLLVLDFTQASWTSVELIQSLPRAGVSGHFHGDHCWSAAGLSSLTGVLAKGFYSNTNNNTVLEQRVVSQLSALNPPSAQSELFTVKEGLQASLTTLNISIWFPTAAAPGLETSQQRAGHSE